ncbi:hypothetical protein SK069_17080 [Patulibacter brassicae]|jgi:hypothetical protein|uniref:Uncharacterized protein n=1 Tax=Patulibacter brassicae TaxID=1705717 RepID=A0ABU4VPE8_9ACTN|nr:hypothetical protein [Patulibacter brassicae]MDX8153315.1 hypothetical protein [Patulibacter brassicae]
MTITHPRDTDHPRRAIDARTGAKRPTHPARAFRDAMTLPVAAAIVAFALPAAARAHGGIDIAEGGDGGTRILVQGSAAGPGEVDLATTLDGPGSGEGSRVVYWVRPTGRTRSVRIATDRDEGGTHHAEIPTAGRGSWQDWDVSAYVTLSTGRRLRVTNDRSSPPGPNRPARPRARPTATVTRTTPAPSTSAAAAAVEEDIEDVSGQSDGVPGWVLPSLVVLALAGGTAVVIRNRRLTDDEEPSDGEGGSR